MKGEALIVVLCCVARSSGFTVNPHHSGSQTRSVPPFQATTANKDSNGNFDSNGNVFRHDDHFSLPWTEFQDWALRDNVSKYVMSVPRRGAETPTLYVMWRKMSREVVELNGYPAEVLREKYLNQLERGTKEEKSTIGVEMGILPTLDEYEFKTSGGLSGRVYGIPGIAEGSKIETASVREVQETLPKGYVLTDDGTIAYELGDPMPGSIYAQDRAYSLGKLASSAQSAANDVNNFASDGVDGIMGPGNKSDNMMLAGLGGSTAILLVGAVAMNLLSHHLTVNVFWV